jgi:NAD(P)-dependent dehydrogenase (short-subunit alcohol dehydrogenase family)
MSQKCSAGRSERRGAEVSDFEDRTVVVVGAAGALGGGVAEAFVAAGAQVRGLDRVPPRKPAPGVRYELVDVLDDADVAACFDAEPTPWAVVNTVGGFAGHRPLADLDPAEVTEQLRLNLLSAALVTKHALRRLSETGEGRLIHTASRVALDSTGAGFAYSVSKLGVLHLVTMAAAETHGTAITVNAVVPSIIDTPANRSAIPDAAHDQWPGIAEIAPVYRFLASPAAAVVSGAFVPVYGRT